MYMQVDVPMERMPIANWVLIAVTVFCGLFSMVAVDRASRGRDALPDFQPDPALMKQLNNPRLTDEQKEEIIRQAEEKWEREQGQHRTRSESALYRYALFPDREHFHLWQLVTYQFMHAGPMHLFGNMLFLFCFGNAVNAKLGHFLFLGLYLFLGIFAGLAYVIVSEGMPLIGASGAIAGITGVFLVLYPINEIAVWTIRSLIYTGDAWRFPSWVFILFFMAWDFLGTLKLTGETGVAYVCHLGGEVLGVGLTIGLVMARVVRPDRGEQFVPQLMGWLPEEQPRRRKRRRRPPPPPPERIVDI